MRTTAMFLAAGLTAAALSAQTKVTVTGVTGSVIGNFVQVGSATQYKSIAKGTRFTRAATVTAALRGARATTVAAIRPTFHGIVATVHESGAAYSLSMTGSALARTSKGSVPAKEPHVVVYHFAANGTVKGRLTVMIGGTARGKAAAAASVKLGTNTVSWSTGMRPVVKVFPVTVTSTGLNVSVVTQGAAAVKGRGFSSYGEAVTLAFTPVSGGNCTVTAYGTSCSKLTGSIRSSTRGSYLAMKLTGSVANGLGVALIGTRQIKVAIPGTSCFLLTDVHGIGGVFRTDSTGSATHALRLPRGRVLKFNIQDAVVALSGRKLKIDTSNGLAVSCR